MPLREFWYDDPELLWVYRFSFINKLKREEEMMNTNAWLNGYYNHIAIASALSKNVKYLDKPIEFNKKKESKADIASKIKANMQIAKKLIEKRDNR